MRHDLHRGDLAASYSFPSLCARSLMFPVHLVLGLPSDRLLSGVHYTTVVLQSLWILPFPRTSTYQHTKRVCLVLRFQLLILRSYFSIITLFLISFPFVISIVSLNTHFPSLAAYFWLVLSVSTFYCRRENQFQNIFYILVALLSVECSHPSILYTLHLKFWLNVSSYLFPARCLHLLWWSSTKK